MIGPVHIRGRGAVGGSLARALADAGVILAGEVEPADTVLLAVPDDQVAAVAAEAAARGAVRSHQVWLHSSGRLGASALSPVAPLAAGVGSFHPAFVFPRGRVTALPPGVRFAVDCRGAALERAAALAGVLGGVVVRVPAEARAAYHAAAVMASNHTVALVAAARDVLAGHGIPGGEAGALLAMLARGAAESALELGAETALTGPIRRGDEDAVAAHLSALEGSPAARDLYLALARETLALAVRDPGYPPAAARTIAALLAGDPPNP